MRQRDTVMAMAEGGRLIRTRDLRTAGISSVVLTRMVEAGDLECTGRGVYRAIQLSAGDETSLRVAEIATRYPSCLVCLVSAARLHRLTDDMNSDWTIAIPTKSAYALPQGVRLHRWMSPAAYESGVVSMVLGGVQVRITDPARTVADMIRSRNGQSIEHALGAYVTFLASGGEPEEVSRHARILGFGAEVEKLTPLARRMLDAGAFPESSSSP